MSGQYFYDWNYNFSTDPEWDDLRKDPVVICNGLRQFRVVHCLSGECGFVKKHIINSDQKVMTTGSSPVCEVLMGTVEVRKRIEGEV